MNSLTKFNPVHFRDLVALAKHSEIKQRLISQVGKALWGAVQMEDLQTGADRSRLEPGARLRLTITRSFSFWDQQQKTSLVLIRRFLTDGLQFHFGRKLKCKTRLGWQVLHSNCVKGPVVLTLVHRYLPRNNQRRF